MSAEMTVRLDSASPLTVTGTVTTTPSGTQNVNVTNAGPINVNDQGALAASATLTTATTGNGTTVTFGSAKSNVTLFILVNGTVTAGVVDLQASQDGTNWVKIASSAALGTGVNQQVSLSPGAAFINFRGVVSTAVAGGGSVTATLTYA